MSRTTRDINRITTTIISISARLIVLAAVFVLMYEGATKGYQLGHEIFAPEAVDAEPGTVKEIVIEPGESLSDVAKRLEQEGLISNRFALMVQAKFYEYDVGPGAYELSTSMTSKEMLRLIDAAKAKDADGE